MNDTRVDVDMPTSSKILCTVYAVIALAALIATWSQNLAYVHSLADLTTFIGSFVTDTKVNPASRSITADILLADRCLKEGATVIAPNGKPFTANSIGGAIATRAIMADLRVAADGITGGPAPFAKADRSRFLQALDEALVRLGRSV